MTWLDRPRPALLLCAAFLALPVPAQQAPDEAPPQAEEAKKLEVYERLEVKDRADDQVGIATSATEGATSAEDLALRPILRPGDLLETVPGVVVTQHSGGGKANQYFVRGFNLDHGTDFRITVEGMQVNLPTHGHGQGYSDLNFLIPELVDRVGFKKGPYYADEGDFASAGAASIELVKNLPERIVDLTGGSFEFGRVLVADSFEVAEGDVLVALEAGHYDGPWTRGDDYQRFNGLVRYSVGDSSRGSSLLFMGYDGSWLSTDQIPLRAVEAGQIGRFDLIDSGVRGATQRYSLSAEHHHGDGDSLFRFSAYLLQYELELFSNFTYFLDDPENGDQFEQMDRRLAGGIEWRRDWVRALWGRNVQVAAGLQARLDSIDNGLFGTRNRERITTKRQDEILQTTGGPFAEVELALSEKVRARLGLRAEGYLADVDSNLEINSGNEDDVILSPKLSFIFGPWQKTELYLNLGHGFHSNDARGATIRVDPVSGEAVSTVPPLVRARGGDFGFRTTFLPGLQTTFSVFNLELDSELVFVGDAGATEAGRPSRRQGFEWSNHYHLRDWLSFELDVAWNRARFTDDDPAGERIPGAIDRVISGAIAVEDYRNFFTSLRWRHFSGAALIEDNSVRSSSSTLVNAQVGYRLKNGLRLTFEIFNLLDSKDSDIEYFYASRLPGEPEEGVEDIHFHPTERRSARLALSFRL